MATSLARHLEWLSLIALAQVAVDTSGQFVPAELNCPLNSSEMGTMPEIIELRK